MNDRPAKEKKDLIILDFDGTIFYNDQKDFSTRMPFCDLLDAHTFFSEYTFQTGKQVNKNTEFILVTGRYRDQGLLITHLLELKNFKVKRAFFNQLEIDSFDDEESFLINYWNRKVEIIAQLKVSNEFKSIVILDDDATICSTLRNLNFEVYQAEITKDVTTHALSIVFNPLQTVLTSELPATPTLNPRRPQKEQAKAF